MVTPSHTHTHTLSLFLSLSPSPTLTHIQSHNGTGYTHTHTHTHTLSFSNTRIVTQWYRLHTHTQLRKGRTLSTCSLACTLVLCIISSTRCVCVHVCMCACVCEYVSVFDSQCSKLVRCHRTRLLSLTHTTQHTTIAKLAHKIHCILYCVNTTTSDTEHTHTHTHTHTQSSVYYIQTVRLITLYHINYSGISLPGHFELRQLHKYTSKR